MRKKANYYIQPDNFLNKISYFQNMNNNSPQLSPNAEIAYRIFKTIFFFFLFITLCKVTHFRLKILHDVRINRKFLYSFFFLLSLFILVYFYLLFTLRLLRPVNRRVPVEKWDKIKPVPMYFCTIALILGTFCFIFALWPAFHIMTLVIGIVGYVTMILVFQWIPI